MSENTSAELVPTFTTDFNIGNAVQVIGNPVLVSGNKSEEQKTE